MRYVDAIADVNSLHGVHTRKWDSRTPYVFHPLWCAATLLAEHNLDEGLRHDGAMALLYHDTIEDGVPSSLDLPPEVLRLVYGMTFRGGFGEEQKELWSRPKEILLLKLYDKVSNLLDGHWMSKQAMALYRIHTERLCTLVEQHYGVLLITRIARMILEENS